MDFGKIMIVQIIYGLIYIDQSFKMQSFNLEPSIEGVDGSEEFKKQLGLRKMLFKYQHQNQQLKNQIKALTQRLQTILANKNHASSSTPRSQQHNELLSADKSAQEKLQKYWRQQMQFYYKRIEQVNQQISHHKQIVDEQKQQQYIKLTNKIKVNQKNLNKLRQKITKYQKEQQKNCIEPHQNSSHDINIKIGNLSEEQYQSKLTQDLEATRKRIRQLQKSRNTAAKANRDRHLHIVDLSSRTRELTAPRKSSLGDIRQKQNTQKKMGLWGLELTPENFQTIKQQFFQLQKAKTVMLNSIRIENKNLKQKLVELKNQYIDISNNSFVNLNSSINLEHLKNRTPAKLPLSSRQVKGQQVINLPQIPTALGKSAYQQKNDKNYVEKKSKTIEWQMPGYKRGVPGLSWNDENCKSPITGINLWFDKHLLGLQFIHTLSQSNEHLHLVSNKKITPILYRLNNNDYLENIVLIIMSNPSKQDIHKDAIVGMELISKNGRKDSFGQKIGSSGTQKFDFSIKTPEKPIYSFGSFTINSKSGVSCINRLGFAVV